MKIKPVIFAILSAITLIGCGAGLKPVQMMKELNRNDTSWRFADAEIRLSVHRDNDDLLTAGLGLEGLLSLTAPELADENAPTASELRRRALYANWRGIADLASGHGLGAMSVALPNIPGREWTTFSRLPGRKQTHRLLAQVPDAFDQRQRCLVVTAASGSRGIYGAIAVASAWGLPKGCAVVHTDKAAGSGFFDIDSNEGFALDGTPSNGTHLDFDPRPVNIDQPHRIALKHMHSGDNSEADWGLHVLQAVHFGLYALAEAFPAQAPFTTENTRIIAVGISNGGAAILRASELDELGIFDAVIASEPNITAPGARPLFDYATEAALYAPCAMTVIKNAPAMLPVAVRDQMAAQRCASLHTAGLLISTTPQMQQKEALERLQASGWSMPALMLSEQNVAFDLWRTVALAYAQTYAQTPVDQPVCGAEFAIVGPDGKPRASTPAERAIWWSDSSGIAPTVGISLLDRMAAGSDPAFAALQCARSLWEGDHALSATVRAAIAKTTATARPRSKHIHILHGIGDGLIPIDFSSRPYVRAVRNHGIEIEFSEIENAQHFDSFIAFPVMSHYQAMLPHVHRALDAALDKLMQNQR